MQHHGHLLAQGGQVVVPYVPAAHLYAALGSVIQAGDELDQAALAGARAPQDAHRGPRGDVEGDIRQAGGVLVIAKGHMVKGDGPVGDILDGGFGGLQVAGLPQDLHDALPGALGDGDEHQDHGEHHQGGEDEHGVGDEAGQLPGGQLCAPGQHDHPCPEPEQQHQAQIDHKLHQGGVEGHVAFRPAEALVQAGRDALELVLFKILPHEGLDHPDGLQVFLDHAVEGVVGVKDHGEQRVALAHQPVQAAPQQGDHDEEEQGELRAEDDAHGQGKDQHQGRPHGDADDHLIGGLDVGHVGGQAGDQAGGGKMVDVGKGKVLDVEIQVLPQVAGKARRGRGSPGPGHQAEDQPQDHQDDHTEPQLYQGIHAAAVNALVDDLGGEEGQEDLQHHFQGGKKGRLPGGAFVFPQTLEQGFDHLWFTPFDW